MYSEATVSFSHSVNRFSILCLHSSAISFNGNGYIHLYVSLAAGLKFTLNFARAMQVKEETKIMTKPHVLN